MTGEPDWESLFAARDLAEVFAEGTDVEVRYPRTKAEEQGDRSAWPWLPGWIVQQCGPDEWEVCVETPELAAEHEGETVYPCCYRDSSEIRTRS